MRLREPSPDTLDAARTLAVTEASKALEAAGITMERPGSLRKTWTIWTWMTSEHGADTDYGRGHNSRYQDVQEVQVWH